jgi:biotin transport system substrate-specific component
MSSRTLSIATPAESVAGVVLFAALTAIGSHIRLPLQPVPFTMQVFFVLLSGVVLGSSRGAMSQLTYIAMGLAGAPVFAATPHAGVAVLTGPTGGYLLGFVLASYIAGWLAERNMPVLLAGLAGLAFIYLFGYAVLARYLGSSGAAWRLGVQPFIFADLLKVAALMPARPGWSLWREV